jgi:RNA polymerase-binding transcription factor DksA
MGQDSLHSEGSNGETERYEMTNGSAIPADVRSNMERQRRKGQAASAGIGGKAAENMPRSTQEVEAETRASAEEKEKDVAKPICKRCKKVAESEWRFCASCGKELTGEGAAKRLGIDLNEQSLQDYLFKGYIVCNIKVFGKHTITIKSSQPKDLSDIDDYLMNGEWTKDAKGEAKNVSDFYLRQMNAVCVTASAVAKIDGDSIGETLVERVAWFMERGAAFVDTVSQRVTLFNQALTEFLQDEDAVLGS